MSEDTTLAAAADAVREAWSHRRAAGEINEHTEALYRRHLDTFLRYAAAHRVTRTSQVTANLCTGWVSAPVSAASPGSRGRAGQPAAPATRRGRQGALREVLAVWAEHEWVAPGLLRYQVIPKVPAQGPCPLTPSEATRLRLAGQQNSADTLLPVLVAIALAGANHTEISSLRVASFDPDSGQVAVAGRGGRTMRRLALDAHATRVIAAHIEALGRAARRRKVVLDPAATPLCLHPSPRSLRAHVTATTVGQHLYRALGVAGITRPGVTPRSLQDYAANRCYALTNRVEEVADLLGLASLDAAMHYVDRDWQARHAATIREQQD